MGYRSEVRIATTPKGWQMIQENYPRFLKPRTEKSSFNEEELFDLLDWMDHFKSDDTGVYFGWDNIKWYSSFPEINAMVDTLNFLEDKEIPYQLVRLGEDYADIYYDDHLGNSEVKPFWVFREIRGGC